MKKFVECLVVKRIRTALLFLSIASLIFLAGCGDKGNMSVSDASDEVSSQAENSQAKVTFFDVGKGDAILVETGRHFMLIDSGYDETSDVLLDYMKEQNISYLDYLVVTHFDKDHVGGADWILKEIKTGTVLQPDYESDSGQYQEYVKTMEAEGVLPTLVTNTMEVFLDGADFLIYPPQRKNYEEEDNDFSLVVSMTCGEMRFLFAGDCEKERLKELLQQKEFALSHDVLKVPHHGRKEKNSEEFLTAVGARAAVITSSEEKPADEEVCRILEDIGTEIYFTKDGTITCLCDGKELQVLQQ